MLITSQYDICDDVNDVDDADGGDICYDDVNDVDDNTVVTEWLQCRWDKAKCSTGPSRACKVRWMNTCDL